MSIWDDCKLYEALPFFGFSVKPSIINGFIVFYFPEGYEPNGSKTIEVAKQLIKLCGKKDSENEITDKKVKIKIDNKKMSYIIYDSIING